jgi:uncharacterized protein YbaR (Trm112 family)
MSKLACPQCRQPIVVIDKLAEEDQANNRLTLITVNSCSDRWCTFKRAFVRKEFDTRSELLKLLRGSEMTRTS